jgi:hypothetical protein
VSTRDDRCGAVWSGHRTEHCTVCHRTLSGSTTGDAHRVGPHDGDRRCLTDGEMLALGLWPQDNQYGTTVWHGSPNKAGEQKRRPQFGGAA